MFFKLLKRPLGKKKFALLLAIILSACCNNLSFAELSLPFDPAPPEAGPYTTAYGETEEKNIFTLSETPYVFFQFKKSDLQVPPEIAELFGFGENWLGFCSD